MKVIKSSGLVQEFDEQKILTVLEWACKDTKINPYDIIEKLSTHITDNMTTSDIQTTLVKVTSNLINTETTDYQYVASNLAHFGLRKHVYNQFDPIPFYEHIKQLVQLGVYDKEILIKYTKEEIEFIEKHIDHDKDFKYTFAGTQQLIEKYLVQDRSTDRVYETPQFAFALISMCLHQEEKSDRLEHVIAFYNAVADQEISLPTPIMAGVRTPTRQFSSCVVIESGDSLKSINRTNTAIVDYIARRAGIGINAGAIRAEGSKIRQGEVKHTGVTPFYKTFAASTASSSQGGIRKGSANLNYPFWHLEFENMIVLKNNKGTEDNRIRHIDYTVQFNDLFFKRYLDNDYVTLFSPDVLGGQLYETFFSDQEKFEKLYSELELNPNIRKKRVKAAEIFETQFMNERANTARIYKSNVDNVNNYGPWIRKEAPIKMSNLCVEIALFTKAMGTTKDSLFKVSHNNLLEFYKRYGGSEPYIPFSDKLFKRVSKEVNTETHTTVTVTEDDSLINLCTLSAFVLDKFDYQDQNKVNKIAKIMVRALDNLLDYQDYPVKEALHSKDYRSLGIGVTNYSGFLASQMLSISEAETVTHELFERLQFGLINASVDLAEERGPANEYKKTKYGKGQLPIDWYKKTIDDLAEPVYVCDWEYLRARLIKFGIRNCTLSALMPCESSSQVSNSTNGIEQARGAVSVKSCKTGSYNQVVPKYEDNQLFYEYLWDTIREYGNKPYLRNVCIMQKWVDQGISTNTSYNPSQYQDNKVPMSELVDDALYYWYYGGKNLYYHNTADGAGEEDKVCESCSV